MLHLKMDAIQREADSASEAHILKKTKVLPVVAFVRRHCWGADVSRNSHFSRPAPHSSSLPTRCVFNFFISSGPLRPRLPGPLGTAGSSFDGGAHAGNGERARARPRRAAAAADASL